ncbi:hypothetical protein SVAN01_00315 [Stagonosporopsis vannaccii]|nr:hypothetical protein SVAN01_00315 [Stagonosporopsis vannaccii]
MPALVSLPTELICEILGHVQPVTELHKSGIAEEDRWDIRHWGRTITAVARTCRLLRDIAVPLLYSRYEGAFHSPITHFIDRTAAESALQQSLRHIAVRTNGWTNDKYAPTQERLSQYHAWAKGSELELYGIKETYELTSEDAGQIELWRLISQAPNLESLHITAYNWLGKADRSPNQAPMWLFPIVSAAQNIPTSPHYNGWFRKLLSLKIDLQDKCGIWLVHLFSLPSLQSLCLLSMGSYPHEAWAPALTWPDTSAISTVRDLDFVSVAAPADVIVKLAGYCKALKSFKCSRAFEKHVRGYRNARQWCVDILDGLQRHKQTLLSLTLHPSDRHSSGQLSMEYERLKGFQTLVALDSLNVPWHILMGSPECFRDEQDAWEPMGYWQYPVLRDVLPENLRHLKTSICDYELPNGVSIEEALFSGLPPQDWEDDVLLLKSIDFSYFLAHYFKPLPLNFWKVKDAFHKDGCTFTYKYKLDPMDFQWKDLTGGDDMEFSTLATTLAKEGPPGVHIALRCDAPGLARRVMKCLGLGKEWLDTEEAQEILFGEKVDYDYLNWWEKKKSGEHDTSGTTGHA